MANANLIEAKEVKNDEFYTQLSDIQIELSNYTDKFQGKVVFCNCNDTFESNFVKYFLMNFNKLGLKELIATGYKTNFICNSEIDTIDIPYVLRVTDTSKYLMGMQKDLDISDIKHFLETKGNCIITPLIGNIALDENGEQIKVFHKESILDENGNEILLKSGKPKMKSIEKDLYYEAGDFRSDMSLSLLKQSDIVVTNPPFSLFREYVAILMKYNKQFLIIGNMNATTYKEIFPYIRNNKLWLGVSRQGTGSMWFRVPKGSNEKSGQKIKNGEYYQTIGSSVWFTNMEHTKRHIMMPLILDFTYKEHKDMYPTYDNYDAININKVEQIPCDFDGVMGVPITFLGKYCPEQFEIVIFRKSYDGKLLIFTREREVIFNNVFEFLTRNLKDSDNENKIYNMKQQKELICLNFDMTEDVKFFAEYICSNPNLIEQALVEREKESIEIFFKFDTDGVHKLLLGGKEPFKRILIKKR